MLDSDNIGFLSFTVSPTMLKNLSSTPFLKPPNPGTSPTIPPNTTGIK